MMRRRGHTAPAGGSGRLERRALDRFGLSKAFHDSVAAVSGGVVGATPLLDLDSSEESTAETDMNVVMTGDGRLIEVQATAERDPFARETLDELLERAVKAGVFGTKMRSVIAHADADGIEAVVAQQFEIGRQIVGHALVPIIEPEVDIHSDTKGEAEELLRDSIARDERELPDAAAELGDSHVFAFNDFRVDSDLAELIHHDCDFPALRR